MEMTLEGMPTETRRCGRGRGNDHLKIGTDADEAGRSYSFISKSKTRNKAEGKIQSQLGVEGSERTRKTRRSSQQSRSRNRVDRQNKDKV
jgi:hypothetical protein